MNECTLGVHKVKLVVKSGPGLSDGGGVGEHADASRNLGEVTPGDNSRRLVVDADLEAGWTPVYKLNRPLGLDGCDGSIDILWDHVSSVEHAAGHVLAVARVALHHLVGGLEASVGDLGDCELLVVGLLSRDDGGIHCQREMNPE